jgi:hypothetical protein
LRSKESVAIKTILLKSLTDRRSGGARGVVGIGEVRARAEMCYSAFPTSILPDPVAAPVGPCLNVFTHKGRLHLVDPLGICDLQCVINAITLQSARAAKGKVGATAVPVLSPDDVIWVIRQLVAGLQCIHASGWIHHDVKPGNVIVRSWKEGEREHEVHACVQLIDFGINSRNPGVLEVCADVESSAATLICSQRSCAVSSPGLLKPRSCPLTSPGIQEPDMTRFEGALPCNNITMYVSSPSAASVRLFLHHGHMTCDYFIILPFDCSKQHSCTLCNG